ncbi:MAG: hypothetical protein PQJ50_13990 [Spirochaetales bacterium]|nr:hypothetical protein [Spirochaetales bacterium]
MIDLQLKMTNLQKRIELLEEGYIPPFAEANRESSEHEDTGIPIPADPEKPERIYPLSVTGEPPLSMPEAESPQNKSRTARAYFQNISDRFSDRWTGILGVTALVIGFSFLAVLTALRMGPVARFFMIAGISLAFWLLSMFMEKRKKRVDISCWFQSASGALILFACLGASSIPWLRWAESEIQGYAMMFTGIAVNLYFALRVQTQLFSSFHTLISLAALAAAPSSAASLSAATLVTAFSSVPMMRRHWGLHQLFAQSGFFLFIIVWVSLGKEMDLFSLTGIDLPVFAALLGGMLPGLAAPYVHLFRGEYKGDRFSYSSRAASWLFVATGTFALGGKYSWTSLIFMVLGGGAYLSGRFIGKLPAPMRRLDSISGIALIFGAILGLRTFHLDYFTATGIAGIVALLAVMDGRREKILRTVFSATALAVAMLLLVLSSIDLISGTMESAEAGLILQKLGLLYLFSAYSLVLVRKFSLSKTSATLLLTAAAGVGMLSVYLTSLSLELLPEWLTVGGLSVTPLLALAIHKKRNRTGRNLSGVILGIVVLIHIYSYLFHNPETRFQSGDLYQALEFVILSLGASLLLISMLKQKKNTLSAIILFTVNLCGFTAAVTREYWFLYTLWALISILENGLFRIPSLNRSLKKSLNICGTGLSLITALLALVTLMISVDTLWWQRLIQSTVIFTALIAWNFKTVRENDRVRTGLLLASALFATLVVVIEADIAWVTIICVTAALLMLVSGTFGPEFLKGYRPLSLIFFWAGILILPFSGIGKGNFFIETFGLPWWTALGSISISLIYITAVYLFPEDRKDGVLQKLLLSGKSGALLYPYFAGIGVFLFLSFSGPVLTSLLILESFALFIPGILLKENSFRISSFLLILFCLGRLIFIDMARTDTLERAVVFILTGAVLLGMNWMYGHFARKL